MTLDLNTDNIDTILVNISCCIDKLSKQLLLFASTGNKKCFELTNDKILVLDEIYNILKDNFKITYPIYQADAFGIPNISLLFELIDNSTGATLANGVGATRLLAVQDFITNIGSSTLYIPNTSYNTTTTDLSIILDDYECSIDNLSIIIFDTTGRFNVSLGIFPCLLIDQGNCQTRVCFTQDELNKLYQQALNLCNLCNCT